MMGVDHNVRHVTDSLFRQDYGSTAGTLLAAEPTKYAIANKKVPMQVFVQLWNKYSMMYQKYLRDNVSQQPYNTASIVALLKQLTPIGQEPWMFSQLKTVSEIVSSISMAGVVAAVTTNGKSQTLFLADIASESECRPGSVDVRARNPTSSCLRYYLICYSEHMADLDQNAVRFTVIASDTGPGFFLQSLAGTVRPNNDAAYLLLGTMLSGGTNTFVQESNSDWRFFDINAFSTDNYLRIQRTHNCCSAKRPNRVQRLKAVDPVHYKVGHFRTKVLRHQRLNAV